jgi:outer membrane protein OmpA-like peptidoglycan-associated protein
MTWALGAGGGGPELLAVALLSVVVLAGCGGSSAARHSSGHVRSTGSSTARAKSTVAVSPKAIVAVDDVQPGGDPTSTHPAEHARVTIYDLRRYGPFVILDLGIRCLEPAGGSCDSEFDWATPSYSAGAIYANANTPDGISLVDPAQSKEYWAVTDSQNRPDVSELPQGSIDDNYTHLAWVTFPAPPAGTQTMDVELPNGGPQVPNVPVTDGPAPDPQQLGQNVVGTQPAPFAFPAGSTSTAGLTLLVENLVSTVGNPAGSDAESPTRATLTLNTDVLFRFDKSSLTPRARAIISSVAAKIKSRATGQVSITGYTDSIGTDQVNIPLSQARAHSVAAVLAPLTQGGPVTYQTAGLGSNDPVAPNTKPDGSDNPAGRALNRRVTISFAVKELARPSSPPDVQQPTAPPPAATARTVAYHAISGSDTDNYNIAVYSLVRDANMLVLHLGVGCRSVVAQDTSTCSSGFDFTGSQTVPPVTLSQNEMPLLGHYNIANTTSAFYLVDPTTGTQYIPLHDTNGTPLSAGIAPSMPTGGYTYPLWIYFPAPPTSTTSMTVVIPGGGAQVAGVPITG